jgi:predicted heme/steroid binding protein
MTKTKVKVLTEERKFTLNELAEYNGKGGKPAYIAFEGKVYDVSASVFWSEGEHMGIHEAGRDLTNEIELAPHRKETLDKVKLVGVLV